MSRLVGVLAMVLAASAVGCMYRDTGSDVATINAQWAFRSEGANLSVGCPAGFDTVALNSQELDGNGAPTGRLTVDLFDCTDGFGSSDPLAPSMYQTWIDVTSSTSGARFAQSLTANVDVTTSDQTFDTTILTDGGYFKLDWDLVGATSNQRLDCSDVDIDGVRVIGTSIASANITTTDRFTCGDHTGVSGGFLQGAYSVTIDAFHGDTPLGAPVSLASRTIRDRNQVTDLGHINIPIAGR